MNNEFPRMLFKAPGPEQFHGGHFDTKIVSDEDERDEALDSGWHLTTTDASEAYEQTKAKAVAAPADPVLNTAPEAAVVPEPEAKAPAAEAPADHDTERAALKAEANARGLVFPKNATNDKLRELIAADKAPAAEGEG